MGMDSGVPKGVILNAVPNTNGKYFAGSDGHIYCNSDARCNAKKPKPFKLEEWADNNTQYPIVSIILDGVRRSKSVHGLVCLAFNGKKPSPIHEVRHLDGTRNNATPSNLLWGTPAENEADKRRHGTVAEGSRHGIAKLNE